MADAEGLADADAVAEAVDRRLRLGEREGERLRERDWVVEPVGVREEEAERDPVSVTEADGVAVRRADCVDDADHVVVAESECVGDAVRLALREPDADGEREGLQEPVGDEVGVALAEHEGLSLWEREREGLGEMVTGSEADTVHVADPLSEAVGLVLMVDAVRDRESVVDAEEDRLWATDTEPEGDALPDTSDDSVLVRVAVAEKLGLGEIRPDVLSVLVGVSVNAGLTVALGDEDGVPVPDREADTELPDGVRLCDSVAVGERLIGWVRESVRVEALALPPEAVGEGLDVADVERLPDVVLEAEAEADGEGADGVPERVAVAVRVAVGDGVATTVSDPLRLRDVVRDREYVRHGVGLAVWVVVRLPGGVRDGVCDSEWESVAVEAEEERDWERERAEGVGVRLGVWVGVQVVAEADEVGLGLGLGLAVPVSA